MRTEQTAYERAIEHLERNANPRYEDLLSIADARERCIALEQHTSDAIARLDMNAGRVLLNSVLRLRQPEEQQILKLHQLAFALRRGFLEASKYNPDAVARYKQLSIGNTLLQEFEFIFDGPDAGLFRGLASGR